MRSVLFVLALMPTVAWSTEITGLVVVSSDSRGNDPGFGAGIWTTSAQHHFKLWVNQGEFNGRILNGPSASEAAVSLDLFPGNHTFTFQAAGDVITGPQGVNFYALNMFFNGNNTVPAISAFAPLHLSGDIPAFLVNRSQLTSGLDLDQFPPAGTLSYNDGENLVTLTNFWWSHGFAQDRIGPTTAVPDGMDEFVGRITLNVVPIPEPATWGMLLVAAVVGGLHSGNRNMNKWQKITLVVGTIAFVIGCLNASDHGVRFDELLVFSAVTIVPTAVLWWIFRDQPPGR